MKLFSIFPFFIYSFFLNIASSEHKNVHVKEIIIHGITQGTTYSIKYLANDSIVHSNQIDSILQVIDSSLSLYKPYSIISRFNSSIKCLSVDAHLSNVITAANIISESSNGLFDITCKPISELWGFGTLKKSVLQKPDSTSIQNILRFVGYKNVVLNKCRLCKSNLNIKLDCDGIAQGYTVDVIAEFLVSNQISNFIVEVGGEIRTSGKNIHNVYWSVGIEDPSYAFQDNFLVKHKVQLVNAAITTSGNYRKFKQYGNEYFSHIINPQTGYPVNNGIVSVSVIANNATMADGWDNAFMLMGVNNAISKADSLHQIGLYILYLDNSGNLMDTCNNLFKNSLH